MPTLDTSDILYYAFADDVVITDQTTGETCPLQAGSSLGSPDWETSVTVDIATTAIVTTIADAITNGGLISNKPVLIKSKIVAVT